MYTKQEYESFSATNSGEADTWGLFADWRVSGPHSLQFQYVDADDTKGNLTAGNTGAAGKSLNAAGQIAFSTGAALVFNGGAGGTGAKQYGVRYSYDFSKRTAFRVAYSIVDNDANARYGLYTTGVLTAAAGERVRGFGLNFDHRF
jgi:predicted porin